MSYEINLPVFQGPFDLLLFFIERDELNINDIPIAKVTNDFLDYIHQLEKMEMEVASEFILVAATLMNIKSRVLLPRPELDEEGNEIDPRDELVRHLLEYKKYKSVVSTFQELEYNRSLLEKRGNIHKELKAVSERNHIEYELQDLDLYKLLQVYVKVMKRHAREQEKPSHKIVPYPYSIDQQKKFLLDKVAGGKEVAFSEIIDEAPGKIAVIYNFLAVLELLQLQYIDIYIGMGYNNFWVHQKEKTEDIAPAQ